MPKNKSRRGDGNGEWEASRSEEGESVGNSNGNRIGSGSVNEIEESNDNGEVRNEKTDGNSRTKRGDGSSQQKKGPSLGQGTDGVAETLQSLGVALQAIKDLQGKFTSHVVDLRKVEETKEKVTQLEAQCDKKDKEMRDLDGTVSVLTKKNQQSEEEIMTKWAEIGREKKELEKEKEKLEKRVNTTIGVERSKLKAEFDKLVTEQDQSHNLRRKELEDTLAKKRDENNKQLTVLNTENKKLSKTVKEQEKALETKVRELEKLAEKYDDSEGAKKSFKSEKLGLETELQDLKTEFALCPRSTDYLYVFDPRHRIVGGN
jgi:chromosome segregation ATPase